MALVHSSKTLPRIVPFTSSGTSVEIDRCQSLDFSISSGREKQYEIGREAILGYKQATPATTVNITQHEYGNIELWQKLANVTATKIELTDFKTSACDIYHFDVDDLDTFIGTVWCPQARISGFSVGIGDPDATITRTINLVGESTYILDGKYLIVEQFAGSSFSGSTGQEDRTYAVFAETPLQDQDNSGQYLLFVTLNGVALEWASSSPATGQFSYNSGTTTLTIGSALYNTDYVKVYYMASDYPSGVSTFTLNDTDVASLEAKCCTIELTSGTVGYKLQSVNVDVSFSRTDYKEVGNKNVVQRGVSDIDVTVTLSKKLENLVIERLLRGVDSTYGKLDIANFIDTNTVTIKVYDNESKDNFVIGYKFTGLSLSGYNPTTPLRDYIDNGITLIGTDGFISNQIGDF